MKYLLPLLLALPALAAAAVLAAVAVPVLRDLLNVAVKMAVIP